MSDKYYHPDTDFLRKLGAAPPSVSTHGTESDISQNLKQLLPNKWHLEGNELVGMTGMGELRQTIDPAYILEKVEKGLPVFRRVVV